MSPDARQLIAGMLVVDPVKRMTIEEVVQHPYYTKDLPRYLTPLPTTRSAVLGTLQNLAAAPKPLDFEIIDGLGRIEEEVIDELAERMDGVDRDDIWDSLRRDDGATGNAVKVAYLLLRDKRRLGQDLAVFEEQERDAQLALMDPRNAVSPNALSPTGANDLKTNPFETQFRDGFGEDEDEGDDDDDDDDDDAGLDFSTPPPLLEEFSNFAVLNSSLPESHGPEQHHLTSYASAKRMGGTPTGGAKDKKQSRTKWHFGIRSRSPPMEVMHEIYRVLRALGMEWREKRDLGGLGGIHKDARPPASPNRDSRRSRSRTIERAPEYDGVDFKKAASIYFVETRGRVGEVVVCNTERSHTGTVGLTGFQVLMNVQLYMVDSINYLVDFHHKKSYKASTEPDAGPFEMEIPDHISETGSDGGHIEIKEEDIVSPFVFMDLACRLILELAGGPE
jgi:carbon catabolite-derepressing protein kinase